MIRYICDLCQCELDPQNDVSYVVRMEVYAAPSFEDAPIDSDRDHLEDFQEVLERFDEFDADGHLLGVNNYRKQRFDLCKECAKRFLQDPLGRRDVQRFEMSKP